VSIVLVATAVGAILGPNLIKLTGALARNLDFPALAGPFMLAAVAYVSGALVLWVLLRPDPLLLARSLAAAEISKEREVTTEAPPASAGRRWSWPLASGAGIMIITQLIMVAIMTMTPIHIEHHGHGIGITGIVIGAHVAGMFLPSPLSGWLVDRFGYLSISVAAGVTLLAAGLIATWAPVDSVSILVLALVLLGVGWNLGLVSGTTLVTDAVPLATRAHPGRSRSWHRTGGCDRRAQLRADLRSNQLRHPYARRRLTRPGDRPDCRRRPSCPQRAQHVDLRSTVQSSLC
jgi:drug/metabolite transporter superfamily protein YnfA